MRPVERFRDADPAVQIAVALAVLVGAGIALVVLVTALALVIGVFGTLGLGDPADPGVLQASWKFEVTPDGIRSTHGGGDSVWTVRLAVEFDGTQRAWSEGDRAVEVGDEITVSDLGPKRYACCTTFRKTKPSRW